jgi:hypothetical protein
VRVKKGEGGSWAVPPILSVAGSEVLKGGLLEGRALMDLTDPGDPELLFDVDEMIDSHLARETAAQDEGRSKIRKKRMSKPKQPRARGKAAKEYRDPKRRTEWPAHAARRLVCVCGSERPRFSSVNVRSRLFFEIEVRAGAHFNILS